MNQPIIILGGGIWGCLLAYKLRESLPEIDFILYEEGSVLGRHETWTFRESDCAESLSWLKPLISQSWEVHGVNFSGGKRIYRHPCHLIDGRHLHEVLLNKLPKEFIRLNNKISPELAAFESSFVIDTRDICHFKKAGFRKFLTVEMELQEEHGISAPVLYDARLSYGDSLRVFSYFPLSLNTLLVKDSCYSSDQRVNIDDLRGQLTEAINFMGWKVQKILREEMGAMVLPTSKPLYYQEGRIINLAGLFHDTTGCSIPHATRLIEKMVSTSFRFGELKEIVSTFREGIESDRKFFRYINKLLTHKKPSRLFEVVYQEPELLEKFNRGKLNLFDRSRILMSGHFQ